MIKTETAAIMALAKVGVGPTNAQTAKASTAAAMTPGTNHADT